MVHLTGTYKQGSLLLIYANKEGLLPPPPPPPPPPYPPPPEDPPRLVRSPVVDPTMRTNTAI